MTPQQQFYERLNCTVAMMSDLYNDCPMHHNRDTIEQAMFKEIIGLCHLYFKLFPDSEDPNPEDRIGAIIMHKFMTQNDIETLH